MDLSESVAACIANADALLEDVESLRWRENPSTAFALCILAQEEYAKAFILQQVSEGNLPWTPELRRALSHHHCKHLIGVVMLWLHVSNEDLLERLKTRDLFNEPKILPKEVAVSLNILRHELFEKFKTGYAFREKEWDGQARRISEGLLDREKQSALYVAIGADGKVTSTPASITAIAADEACWTAHRIGELAKSVKDKTVLADAQYTYLKKVLKVLFVESENMVCLLEDQQATDS